MGLNIMKEYKYKINGNEYNVAVEELEGNKANVTVNGKTYEAKSTDIMIDQKQNVEVVGFENFNVIVKKVD